MLDIINELSPFIEDCYKEVSVREYSRLKAISAPTASIRLKVYEAEGILKKREDKGYLLFRADRESSILAGLSQIYWKTQLSALIKLINDEFHNPTIILFGSLAKLEAKQESDIDIAIISKSNKKIELEKLEKQLKRNIQVFSFKSFGEIKEELRKNIINGYVLGGQLE